MSCGAAGRRAQIHQGALQPAPYARAVATVDVTELALEIGLFAGHYAVVDDEREGHQHHQQPQIVERDGQADQTSASARTNTIAPSQLAGRSTGRNGKGTSQLSASPAITASPNASGGRIMTRAVSAVSSMAGL